MEVILLARTPDAKRVAFSAIRSCYSPNDSNYLFHEEFEAYERKTTEAGIPDSDRLIRQIVSSGHTSTMEHISFTFSIIGLSRACLAQLTRHRVGWSYSVQSQRYVKQSSSSKHGEFGFVYPTFSYLDADKIDAAGSIVADAVNYLQDAYDALVGLGVKAEDARSILPMNSECNLTVTCNLRAFMSFWKVRNPETHAQDEIKELAVKMKDAIIEAEPWVAGLWEH